MGTAALNFVAVIDDDASLRRSMARLLAAVQIQSVSFPSAEEFLSYPLRGNFCCLLVDVQLGGMSGIDLQRQLATEGDLTPIVFITAHDEPSIRDSATRGGCAGYFLKTDSGALITDSVRRAAGQP